MTDLSDAGAGRTSPTPDADPVDPDRFGDLGTPEVPTSGREPEAVDRPDLAAELAEARRRIAELEEGTAVAPPRGTVPTTGNEAAAQRFQADADDAAAVDLELGVGDQVTDPAGRVGIVLAVHEGTEKPDDWPKDEPWQPAGPPVQVGWLDTDGAWADPAVLELKPYNAPTGREDEDQ